MKSEGISYKTPISRITNSLSRCKYKIQKRLSENLNVLGLKDHFKAFRMKIRYLRNVPNNDIFKFLAMLRF